MTDDPQTGGDPSTGDDPHEVRRRLAARAERVRESLWAEHGDAPHRRRTVAVPGHEFPAGPDGIFPWVAVALVVDPRDRVLLVRHEDHGYAWEPPGGKGEPGEDPAGTAARETREETGIDPAIEELLLVETLEFDYGAAVTAPVTQAVFAGRIDATESPAVREPSIPEVRWFGPDELPANAQFRELAAELQS